MVIPVDLSLQKQSIYTERQKKNVDPWEIPETMPQFVYPPNQTNGKWKDMQRKDFKRSKGFGFNAQILIKLTDRNLFACTSRN